MRQKHKVIGIIGPSGAGKSTILRKISNKLDVHVIPTITDRPSRTNEDELEHLFVSESEFDKLIQEDAFIEVVQPFSLPFRYGVRKKDIKLTTAHIPVMLLRASFVDMFKKHFPHSVIYHFEAPDNQIMQRLQKREDNNNLGTRLLNFKDENYVGRNRADRTYSTNTAIDVLVDTIINDIQTDVKDI